MNRLNVLQMMLKAGSKRKEVTEGSGKLHNEEFYYLFSLQNTHYKNDRIKKVF